MKKDAQSKRLQLWIRFLRTGQSDAPSALPYPELLGEPIRVADSQAAVRLVTLSERAFAEPIAEPIRKAFDEFGLNPANPFAWRLLIYVFAEVHFGTHKSAAGAPIKWTDAAWCQLLDDFNQIQERNPEASESEICSYMKKDRKLKDRYEKVESGTIRRNLQYARNPDRNQLLRFLAERNAEDALGGAGPDAPETREQIRDRALEKALNYISTAWKRRAKNKA